MTDLSIFRIYEPHELKNGRYPLAWERVICPNDTNGDGDCGRRLCPYCAGGSKAIGIKDLVREEAGHRCVRCRHPYVVGQASAWENRPPIPQGNEDQYAIEVFERQQLRHQRYKDAPRAIHWSPCDEQCVHGGPFRCKSSARGWTTYGEHAVDAGERVRAGHETQAAWRILTVHHLNERKFDCRWHNLVALCQRCHLEIQNKVEMNQVWPLEHSDWFKPYAAAFYAYSYLGQELTRSETLSRLDELLHLERAA